ncbi:MAG: hypothetical protein OZ921_09305, partial [Sorangiineae bacterium]|nr:hypothetical protein [Sorangiineae bacterium]
MRGASLSGLVAFSLSALLGCSNVLGYDDVTFDRDGGAGAAASSGGAGSGAGGGTGGASAGTGGASAGTGGAGGSTGGT